MSVETQIITEGKNKGKLKVTWPNGKTSIYEDREEFLKAQKKGLDTIQTNKALIKDSISPRVKELKKKGYSEAEAVRTAKQEVKEKRANAESEYKKTAKEQKADPRNAPYLPNDRELEF